MVWNLPEKKKLFVKVAFPFRQVGSQSVQPVCNEICCGFPWCVDQARIHLSLTTERLSAQAQNQHHRSHNTRVNTLSFPLLTFTHATLVSSGVECQNNRLYVKTMLLINTAALKCILHLISSRRDVQCID